MKFGTAASVNTSLLLAGCDVAGVQGKWMEMFKLIIIALSVLPFLFTLNGDFVFDDTEAILKNKDVWSGSWTNCFYNDFWGTNVKSNLSHKSYRPLTVLSFRLNYILNNKQLTALPFKVTNLFCHVLCCLLVWKTFENVVNIRTSRRIEKIHSELNDISFLAAVLFAVHPIHAEAVCGVVGRADILSGITFFSSFLCYQNASFRRRYSYIFLLICIILSGISMLCKENGITVLGVCLSYDLMAMINKKNKSIYNDFSLRIIIRVTITSISTILLLYGRWVVMGGTTPEFKAIDNPAAFTDSPFSKIATFNYIYFVNSLMLLWPQWLCYDWSMGCIPLIEDVLDYRLILPLSIYIYGMFLLIVLLKGHDKRKTKRVLMLSTALTVIPFLPAANIFYPVGFVIAERILYIPSAGFCLLVAVGLKKIISRRNLHKIGLIGYCLLIVTFGVRSWQRSHDWQNEYQLFMSGLSVCPLNAKIHYNVAKVTDIKNETNVALGSYKEAIRLHPEYYQAMNNLANLLKNQKKYSEAEFYLRNAIRYKHDFPAAWMNLGIILASTKRLQESQNAYKTALKYRKNYPDCFYNLGNLYLEMNRTTDAMDHWLHAVHLNAKHVLAWTNLVALLDNTDQLDKALQIIPKALAELPDSPSINFAVANIYGKMDRFTEAEQYFLKAIKLFGTKIQAIHYANLGVLYHRWKRFKLAVVMYKNALKIDPSFRSAINNLKSLQKLKSK